VDCDVCGFRVGLWTEQDLERTLLMAPHLANQTRYGVTADLTDLLAPLGDDPTDVHDVMHRLHLAGRRVHAATPTASGRVEQLSTSGGGVPKTPQPSVAFDGHGVAGDRQADRANHGRPWQAVCLWSAEVIEELAAEGHPIGFGSAGENITVRGLDWLTLTPGMRLGIGTALLQITSYAIPCAKNARWFHDGYFRRLAHDVTPGKSRLYASVLRDGTASVGDEVVVEP
jgi:MOSC domain-containing protein YiiM